MSPELTVHVPDRSIETLLKPAYWEPMPVSVPVDAPEASSSVELPAALTAPTNTAPEVVNQPVCARVEFDRDRCLGPGL